MKVWLKPSNYERRYSRLFVKLLIEFKAEILNQLKIVKQRKDDNEPLEEDSNDIDYLIAALLLWWQSRRRTLYVNFSGYFNEVNNFNDNQFRLVIKSITGLSISPNKLALYSPTTLVSQTESLFKYFGESADIYREESYLKPIRENWETIQQVYIDKVINESISNIELAARNAVVSGVTRKGLLGIIDKLLDTTSNRVDKFAKDQINNLDTQLTTNRQQSLGFDEYIWITRRDERVRGNPNGIYPKMKPSHFHRDNVIFKWSKPPEGGHPGQAPGCRCTAQIKPRK